MGFYNNPPRVKTDLHWTDILKLAKHPNMVVLKESTTRVGQVAQVCAAKLDMSIMCCCSPNLGLRHSDHGARRARHGQHDRQPHPARDGCHLQAVGDR
ncbi:hypothetical protein [Breoghania sp.]|uniref:hypothetical protein n=1 Tax=Breoghania sp. TaxID=2065378 RepID=UPI00260F8614|nr:hypothetical protein [Breoghania sp.]MDJ0933022.1 hypothetical protein [Breoghania sp.]